MAKKYQTKIILIMFAFVFFAGLSFVRPASAYAAPPRCYLLQEGGVLVDTPNCLEVGETDGATGEEDKCYYVTGSSRDETYIELSCDDMRISNQGSVSDPDLDECSDADSIEDNCIVLRLTSIINVLLAGVGIVVLGAIIFSGIQYTVSQGNPQKTAAARDRIISSLIGLVLYALMFAILQWLIPGGVFN